MSWTKLFFSVVCLLNVFVVVSDSIIEPGAKPVYLSSAILILLSAAVLLYTFVGVGKVLAWNAVLISLTLLIVNGAFFYRIIESPAFSTWTVASKNKGSVEFLMRSPYVKFKSNSQIRSQGARGSDFTYEWTTDNLGFKNSNALTVSSHIDFIALGDSFTEGMGVSVENTWPSQIGKLSSLKVYNAGVQGYAATQFLGAYDLLEKKLPHDGIIIGVLPTTSKREARFAVENLGDKQKGTGGIASIVNGDKKSSGSFQVGFIRAIKLTFYNKNTAVGEIPKSFRTSQSLSSDENWQRYVAALSMLSQKASNEGKRVILIQFPFRFEIYFNPKYLGLNDIHQTNYYVELDLLRSSLPKNVEILDILPYMKLDYQKNGRKMYFEKDGHMNEYGNQLVAKYLESYLLE